MKPRTLLLCTSLLLLSCSKQYHRHSLPISASYDHLWSRLHDTVEIRFQIDEQRTSRDDGVIVTHWLTRGAAQRKVEIQLAVHPDDEQKATEDQRWQVRIAVLLRAKDAPPGAPRFDKALERILVEEAGVGVTTRGLPLEEQPQRADCCLGRQ